MAPPDSATTRLDEYIVAMLPWAQGHQRQAIRNVVAAIIDQQTGCQAQLARSGGHQDAAASRFHSSRVPSAQRSATGAARSKTLHGNGRPEHDAEERGG
jgi:hypothetical protein